MVRPGPCLLALVLVACISLQASAVRLPRLGLADQKCFVKSNYQSHTEGGSVVVTDDGQFEFVPHSQDVLDAVAWGSYLDGAHTLSNFGQLRVTTSGEYSDADQVFAAGFLEGFLTAPRIHQNFENLHAYFLHTMNASLDEPMAWIQEQDDWVRGRCEGRGFAMPPGTAAAGASPESGEDESSLDGGMLEGESELGRRHHRRHKHSKRRHHHDERGDGDGDDAKEQFWDAVCLAIRQFDGVVAGYAAFVNQGESATGGSVRAMTYADFLFMESNGDLYDIIDSMDPSQRPSWSPGGADPEDPDTPSVDPGTDDDPEARAAAAHDRLLGAEVSALIEAQDMEAAGEILFRKIALSGKCSALVKLAPDLSDIFMGHSTWDSYTAMLRIYKHYSFNLTELSPAAQRMSFSSYPGEVFSDDDFFLLSSKMVVLQTTNKIFNDELFEALTPHSVLSWQRVRAANWVASSGQEWVRALETENSGTYNNQYIIVDLKQFVPGEDPRQGLMWVAEQIPGSVVSADMTPVLAMGYWPSMNVPFFPEIYNASGYPDFVSKLERYGQHFSKTTHWLSYTASPRAKIFRRDQSTVTSLEGIKAVMRGNDYKNDPLSEGHPICAVCGRGDLDTGYPEIRGCYDTKVTSWRMALDLEAEAVNGPTRGPGDLPMFMWETAPAPDGQLPLHLGQPRLFDFQFERMSPDPLAEAAGDGCAEVDGGGESGLAALASWRWW